MLDSRVWYSELGEGGDGMKRIWIAAGEGVMIVRHLHKYNFPLGHER